MCKGEAPKDLGHFEVFVELCNTPIPPRKRKQGHVVEVEDAIFLGLRRSRSYSPPKEAQESGCLVPALFGSPLMGMNEVTTQTRPCGGRK